jgi:prolyl-tRNA editing enzyme YbaK/EbsC (Cys-tRNA(Pro) deacylase)
MQNRISCLGVSVLIIISFAEAFTLSQFLRRSTINKPSISVLSLARKSNNNGDSFFLPPQLPLFTMLKNTNQTSSPNNNDDALQHVMETAISLQSQKWDSIRILEKSQLSIFDPKTVHDINAIVFLLEQKEGIFTSQDSQKYILAVLSQGDRVNLSKLQRVVSETLDYSSNVKIILAPAENLSRLCGFASGCVPPLGLLPSPVTTYVEESLLHLPESTFLFGGGGTPNQSTVMPLRTLLDSISNVQTASFRQGRPANTLTESILPSSSILHGHQSKPFFCVEPPNLEVTREILGSMSESPLLPDTFSMVGRITGVRQIARRLVFADFAPPEFDVKYDKNDDRPWRNPRTKDEMAVQLILGKTIMQNLGDQEGEVALRSLKKGQLILIKGTTNVDNLDSLINWTAKRSLDIRVANYEVLLPSRGCDEEDSFSWQQTESNRTPQQTQKKRGNAALKKPSSPPQQNVEILRLNDLYASDVSNSEAQSTITIVDTDEAVLRMHADFSNWRESHPQQNGLVGIDCEWKPNFLSDTNEAQPVLLMQVCFHPLQRVYLLDLQTLLRPLLHRDSPINTLEMVTSNVIGYLFQQEHLVKTGFKLLNDFQRLAASYPHIPEFQQVESVLEVSKTGMKVMQLTKQARAIKATSSLAKMTEYFLSKTLDKEQQVSDWSRRPLTPEQVEYASLDAVITPCLIEHMLKLVQANLGRGPKLSRYNNDTAFEDDLKSWKFIILNQKEDTTAIRRLNAKRVVGQSYIATQSWITGSGKPCEPNVPEDDNEPYTDIYGVTRVPSHTVSIGENAREQRVTSLVGMRIAKSKDGCLAEVLEGNTLLQQPGHKLDFQQRSGYVEFDNLVALFVTMPFKAGQLRKYPNEFIKGDSILTWFIHDHEWDGGKSRLAQKMIKSVCSDSGKEILPSVILFVRRGKESFLCCGHCHVVTSLEDDEEGERIGNILKLHLMLRDCNELQSSTEFQNIVSF